MKKLFSLFLTFLKIGAFTFGGGYAMIALLEHEFITRRHWMDQDEFLDMAAIAESTPGPVAVNSATYLGYKLGGIPGALVSTLAVCLPSFFIIYVISLFFDQFLTLALARRAFRGIQVCVIYLIFSAGIRMLKSLERTALNLLILGAVICSMVLCTVFSVKFSSIFYVLICGCIGLLGFFLRKILHREHSKSQ